MTKEQRLNWQHMYGVCFDELDCKSQAELPQERFMLWLIDKVKLLNKHDVSRSAIDYSGYKASLEADLQNAVELQEQQQREDYNAGREDGLRYAVEMLHKHFG